MKKILLTLIFILLLTGCSTPIKENRQTTIEQIATIDQTYYSEAFNKNRHMQYINLPMYPEILIELYGNHYEQDDENNIYSWKLTDCFITAKCSKETNMITQINFDTELNIINTNKELDNNKIYTYNELKEIFNTDGYISSVELIDNTQIIGVSWKTINVTYTAYFDAKTNKTTAIIMVDN